VTHYPNPSLVGAPSTCDNTTTGIPGYYDTCPDYLGAQFTLALYVLYLVFLNILLVNLIIAIFK
jgi:hypothetical protein